MYRHISVFTLEDKSQIETMVAMLESMKEKCPTIICQEVGVNFSQSTPFGPQFGDIIQIVDFETKEDLDNYPKTPAHMWLVKEGPKMAHVSAIDYKR